jgi:hypothetical protein
MLTEHQRFSCPWCGETNTLDMEPEEEGQWLVQDCRVCCRPIELCWHEGLDHALEVRREGG